MVNPGVELLRCLERCLQQADSLVISAGAGMGIDSGLPDFRGTKGFWRAYPALGQARIAFEEIANPAAFRADPRLAWGFYGHRLQLYRRTQPHRGFHLLRAIAAVLPQGAFVFTSNVDGQFQKAGFASQQVYECHGSLHHLQCFEACNGAIWEAAGWNPEVDEPVCRLQSPLPRCPDCGALARPNVLMFGDGGWLSERSRQQERRLDRWLSGCQAPLVVEIGAGTHVPTVRFFSESLGAPLIRINPDESYSPLNRGASLAMGGVAGIELLWEAAGKPMLPSVPE